MVGFGSRKGCQRNINQEDTENTELPHKETSEDVLGWSDRRRELECRMVESGSKRTFMTFDS